VQSARLILEKNPAYWRADEVSINELRYEHFTSDAMARINLFRAKQIDYATLNYDTVQQAAELNLKIQFHPTGENAMMVFNVRPERPTGNRNLRLAFQAAFNRAEYVNSIVAVPGNKPSISLFPSWLKDSAGKAFQKLHPPPHLREPDLVLTFDGPTARKRAEYFQEYFGRTLGLEILIEQQSVKQFYQKLNAGNFDFSVWGWLPDYNDILTYADLFASWNGNNVGAYSNSEYDRMVRVIQNSEDDGERYAAASRIQQLIFEDAVILPMFEASSAYLVSDRLKGMKRRLFGPDPDYIYARVSDE
jgi:oligopeptide transport system substrate-binding protein